ncbi:MAG TPA: hypothetical protein VGR06_11025 [Actinophytocola sp.]|uniref:hypothetical protein n=1 Tax=Actinophytocola sp. TaxID=1872138 RepID=UPI002E02E8A1|nr:hypothetical protein [Actinophytocola sp.]
MAVTTEADTAVLPAVTGALPPPGRYELRLDRYVLEVAVRVLGRPLLRGRFRAVRGCLEVGEPSTLSLDISAKSLRTNVPLLRRVVSGSSGLWAARHRTIRFTAVVAPDRPRRLDLRGTVRVRHEDHDLPMRARVVHLDLDTVVLAAHGVLDTNGFPRRLHVEAALELAR